MSEDPAVDADYGEGFVFQTTNAGWLRFQARFLPKIDRVSATHLADPFPAMMEWLERICRNEPAVWSISGEGYAVRFGFLPESTEWLGETSASVFGMVAGQSGSGDPPSKIFAVDAVSVEPRRLVSGIYGSFREFVASTDYLASEWESQAPLGVGRDDWELCCWEGSKLGELRSAVVEEWMKGDGGEQGALP